MHLVVDVQFSRTGVHPVHEGLRADLQNRNFTSVFDTQPPFRTKGLRADLQNRNFTSVFGTQASFRVKELRRTLQNRNFTTVFGDQSSFRAKGLPPRFAILLQFLAIEPHFVRKGCDRHFKTAISPQFLVIRARFVRKGCSNLISCERVATDTSRSQVYLSFW